MRTFIGTGLLGSGFVRAWLNRGVEVKVWNRTFSKAQKLEAHGAKVFATPEEAVKYSQRIHLVLRDDVSVDEVLSKVETHLTPGAVIIDHTTTSVEGAIRRTQDWSAKGFVYQHAPVMMGPQNALNATGNIFVSGHQEIIQMLTPELESMTGALMNFGEETGKAAGLKLISNLLLMAVNAGISDALTLAKSLNIPESDLAKLPTIAANGVVRGGFNKITQHPYDEPTWELTMARKDAKLMMDEAEKGGKPMMIIPVIAKEMDEWIDKGFAHKDWAIFASEKK